MKKRIKTIVISIISVLLLSLIIFIVIDVLAFKILCPIQDNAKGSANFTLIKKPYNYRIWKKMKYRQIKNNDAKKVVFGTENSTPGVILLGCEYMYGINLNPEQTLGAKLSKIIDAPVYNLAVLSGGPQHALLKVESGDYDDEIRNSKYAIYLATGEHSWRASTYSNGYFMEKYTWPRYVIKENKLKNNKKISLFEKTYIYQYLNKFYWTKLASFDKTFDIVKMHFLKLNEELKKINPKISLVIILFQDNDNNLEFLTTDRWKELKNAGIVVLDADEMSLKNDIIVTSQEYRLPNLGHPSEKVWDVLAPEIKQELNL